MKYLCTYDFANNKAGDVLKCGYLATDINDTDWIIIFPTNYKPIIQAVKPRGTFYVDTESTVNGFEIDNDYISQVLCKEYNVKFESEIPDDVEIDFSEDWQE